MNLPNWRFDLEQGTDAWLQHRAGRITGTGLQAVMRDGDAKTRRQYLFQILEEQETGVPKRSKFTSKAMENGKERELEAGRQYEDTLGVVLEHVGFVDHPTIPMFGVSPDGIQSTEPYRIGAEIKCPEYQTFWDRVESANRRRGLSPIIDRSHKLQCFGLMECGALEAVDYVNWFPGYPPLIQRIYRDQGLIVEMIRSIKEFQEELEEMRYTLKKADYVWLEKTA